MSDFVMKTRRLMECLGLDIYRESEVPAILGLTVMAWEVRRIYEEFPVDELYALAGKRRDVDIDPRYVLTGQRRSETPGYCRPEQIGDRLRQVRGQTPQRAFAEQLGISRAALQRHEHGDSLPDAELLIALWQAFRVQPTWLLLGDTPEQSFQHAAEDKRAAAADRRAQVAPPAVPPKPSRLQIAIAERRAQEAREHAEHIKRIHADTEAWLRGEPQ